jgi:hypothetical protein
MVAVMVHLAGNDGSEMGCPVSDAALEQVVALALQLSAAEQAQLLERVAANLAHRINEPSQSEPPDQGKTWGQHMLDILDQLDTSAWEAMDMPDSVEWVKEQRRGSSHYARP